MNGNNGKMISDKKSRNSKTRNYIINVNCYTWINNSHGLFDYESENFYKKCFKIKCFYNYYYILKDDINVEIKNEEEINKVVLNKTNLKLICKIKYMNNSYQLIPCIDNIYDEIHNVNNTNNVNNNAVGNTGSSGNNNNNNSIIVSRNNNNINNTLNNNINSNNNDNINHITDPNNNPNININNNNNTINNNTINNNNINNNNNNNNNVNNNSTNVEPRTGETNESAAVENDMDNFWVIVKYLKNKTSVLHEDDVLKLGRVKLKIKKIITNEQQEREYNKSIAPFDEAECETVVPDTEHYIARQLTDDRNTGRTNLVSVMDEHVHDENSNNSNFDNSRNNNNEESSNVISHSSLSRNRHACFNSDTINDNNNESNTLTLNASDSLTFSTIRICSSMERKNNEERTPYQREIQNNMNGREEQEENGIHNFYENELLLLPVNERGTQELNTLEIQGETNCMFRNEAENVQRSGGNNSEDVEKEKSDENVHSSFMYSTGTNQVDPNMNTHENTNTCEMSTNFFNSTRKESMSEKDMNLNGTAPADHAMDDERNGQGNTSGGGGGFFFNYFSSNNWDKMNCVENSAEATSSKQEDKKDTIQDKQLPKNEMEKNAAEENKCETLANLEKSAEHTNAAGEIKTVQGKEQEKEQRAEKDKSALDGNDVGKIFALELVKGVEMQNGKNENTVEKGGKRERESSQGDIKEGDTANKKSNYNKKRNNCENENFEKSERGSNSTQPKENFIKFRKSYSQASLSSCRICLCEYDDALNPLISPCKCKGSMKYVHLNCLRTWMRGRLNVRSDRPSVSFFWKQLNCELCKFPYPTYINVQNKHLELYEIPKPEMPYMIIELMNDRNKGFYIVSLANTKFVRMGRGHDSDVRVNDISVSRFHAMIKYQNGKFYIEDCKSKFGTLIQIRKPVFFNIRKNKFIALQIGRTVMYVYMKRKNWIFLPVCLKLSKTQDEDVSMLDNFSSKLLIDNNLHMSNNNFEYDRVNNEMPDDDADERPSMPCVHSRPDNNGNNNTLGNESPAVENNGLTAHVSGRELRNIDLMGGTIHLGDYIEIRQNRIRRLNPEGYVENDHAGNTPILDDHPDMHANVQTCCTENRSVDARNIGHENSGGNEVNALTNQSNN